MCGGKACQTDAGRCEGRCGYRFCRPSRGKSEGSSLSEFGGTRPITHADPLPNPCFRSGAATVFHATLFSPKSVFSRSMALRMVRRFGAQAMRATLVSFPAVSNFWRQSVMRKMPAPATAGVVSGFPHQSCDRPGRSDHGATRRIPRGSARGSGWRGRPGSGVCRDGCQKHWHAVQAPRGSPVSPVKLAQFGQAGEDHRRARGPDPRHGLPPPALIGQRLRRRRCWRQSRSSPWQDGVATL